MSHPVDGNNVHERFLAIINNLREQEKEDSTKESIYRGEIEKVVFNMAATFAQYNALMEKISKHLEERRRKTIHEPPNDAVSFYYVLGLIPRCFATISRRNIQKSVLKIAEYPTACCGWVGDFRIFVLFR